MFLLRMKVSSQRHPAEGATKLLWSHFLHQQEQLFQEDLRLFQWVWDRAWMLMWGPRGDITLQKGQSTKSQLSSEDFTSGILGDILLLKTESRGRGPRVPIPSPSPVTLSKPANNRGPQLLIYKQGILVTSLSAADRDSSANDLILYTKKPLKIIKVQLLPLLRLSSLCL